MKTIDCTLRSVIRKGLKTTVDCYPNLSVQIWSTHRLYLVLGLYHSYVVRGSFEGVQDVLLVFNPGFKLVTAVVEAMQTYQLLQSSPLCLKTQCTSLRSQRNENTLHNTCYTVPRYRSTLRC